jgi:DNA-binding NarL/FixJ family response regulator
VAVLDVQMPKATGIEVTRWAREKMKSVGVLILTAYDDAPYVVAVLEAGAHGYMLKTAQPQEIVQAIRDVDEGKSALDIEVARRVLAQNLKRDELGVQPLTDREHQVLRLAACGYTNKAIGAQLEISDRTVQGHLAHIFAKLQSSSRTEAVMRAVSLGWLTSEELAL